MAELTVVGQSKVFNYTGNVQTVQLDPGTYQLEVWGASSGGWGSHVNAPGGYSRGVLTITGTTTLYIVCGGKGKDTGHYSDGTGYNGGGLGNSGGSSGGGATHIAFMNGLLSSLESHKDSVLLVAGGGGSNGWSGSFGIGGGLTGVGLIQKLYNGIVTYDNMHGTQTHGGTNGHPGSFGQGGGSTESSTGGGGGGWYGGSGSGGNVGMYPGGGGGSGYVNMTRLANASTHAGDETFVNPQGGNELGHVGNGAARITNIGLYETSYTFCCTNSIQSISLAPGTYKLEAWGAEGGYAAYAQANYMGGKGGYSAGIITLTEPTMLYIGVGGAGIGNSNGTSPGGFNGGGNGKCANSVYAGTSGGGATHFALANGVLSSLASSKSAVLLVAGGGGGAGTSRYNTASMGGCGGGLNGGNGFGSYGPGSGGSQTSGGTSYNSNGVSSNTGASFGQGSSITSTNGNEGSGGGGGWYGGGSGGTSSGAGGGSGYVNVAQLINASTHAGNETFVSPTGGMETGHSGAGVAKITCMSMPLQNPGDSILFDYTGSIQSLQLQPGSYKLETWGAQGGYGCGPGSSYTVYDYGGLGGYSVGTLVVNSPTTLYIHVGGKGSDGRSPYATGDETGGYNGGGKGNLGGGGGGATDIRVGANNLSSRIIVAGGGGGASIDATNRQYGGYGGGLNGQAGGSGGAGGTQSSGYSLGQGGAGTGANAGGGGGGYYGGYGGTTSGDCGGGGGSGYVGGVTQGSTYGGNTSFPAVTGGTETGHAGNGAARITCITNANGQYLLRSFTYTGGSQYIDLRPGIYKLEAWGASGGQGADGTVSNTSWNFGYGGYSKGILTIWKPARLYVHVGGRGLGYNGSTHTAGVVAGGYNGGGNAYHDGGEFGGSGGGATHFALSNGVLSSLSSKTSDILLVAGGGGGSGEDNETAGHGGSAVTKPTGAYNVDSYKGSFGQGAHYVNTRESGGGGGGGYYGGYGGQGGGSNGGTGYASSTLTEVEGHTGVNIGHGYASITVITINYITIEKTTGIESVSSSPDVSENFIPENTSVAISAVIKPGYTFDRWDVQYNTEDPQYHTSESSFEYYYTGEHTLVFTAYATPNTDTPYIVNHYIMEANGSTYTLYQTENLKGTTDTIAPAQPLSLQYYVMPSVKKVNLNGDGSTVINYYYERQKFRLKILAPLAGGAEATTYDADAYWGSSHYMSVKALPGYDFVAWMLEGTESVYAESQSCFFNMPTQNLTLRPLFAPCLVNYVVNHKLLGADLTTYETFETETLEELTDTKVTPSVKTYDYYDSPVAQTVNVNGDGTTIVNYLYPRTIYTLQLTADRGKNTMTAPTTSYMWGKSVSITVTTLPGYAFEQWFDVDDNIQFTNAATYTFVMPHRNLSLNAVINPFAVKYTVQHHIQTLAGGYTLRETDELHAITDTTVTPEFKDYEGFLPKSASESVNVNGDESTLVIYYYERQAYTLIVKYNDQDIVENSYLYETNINLYFDNKARLEPLYAFEKWHTRTQGLFIKQPFLTRTSFLMPARDSYIEVVTKDNRKNTNIYKNIFPDEPLNIDIVYAYEQQLDRVVFDVVQAKHGFSVGHVLCLIDGVYQKARAEDSPKGFPVGIVSKVIDENQFQLMKSGTMPYKKQDFTDSSILYLSNLVAGGMGHYKYVTNKIYIPVAVYMDGIKGAEGRILVNIQTGSIGDEMAPYEKYESAGFEEYTEIELNECIATVLGGIAK